MSTERQDGQKQAIVVSIFALAALTVIFILAALAESPSWFYPLGTATIASALFMAHRRSRS